MGGVGSGAGISYWASRSLLADELAVIRAKAAARIQPQAEGGGGGPLLGDIAYSPQAPSQVARSAGGGDRREGQGRGRRSWIRTSPSLLGCLGAMYDLLGHAREY